MWPQVGRCAVGLGRSVWADVRRTREDGSEIVWPNDRSGTNLRTVAKAARTRLPAWAGTRAPYGDLALAEDF